MLAASILASSVELMLLYPIDSLKVKLQMGQPIQKPMSWMYKGFTYRMGSLIPMRTIFWTSMDISQRKFNCNAMQAGVVAGMAQSIIDIPTENMRISRLTSNLDAKAFNISFLYRGAYLHLLRNVMYACGVSCGQDEFGFLGAAAGAVIGSIASHPIDTLKTRAQAYTPAHDISKLWKGVGSRACLGALSMGIGSLVIRMVERQSS